MEADMAKLRSVNTHFWRDTYIGDLTPDEKLLFLYLLTSPDSSIAGAYECTPRIMAFDTGLPVARVNEMLDAFAAAGKVLYIDGYVVLRNHYKNQKLNANMELGRQKLLKALPPSVLNALEWFPNDSEPLPNDSEPFPNGSPQVKVKDKDKDKVEEQKNAEAALAARAQKFMDDIFVDNFVNKYGRPMLVAFHSYWSEETRSGKRMRFELQPTWKLAGRLATWASREIKSRGSGKPNSRLYHEE
jgi:hypothetical protein